MDRSLVTDENIDDIMETAGFGIFYWAEQPDSDDWDQAPEGTDFIVKDSDDSQAFYFTRDDIRDAYFKCLDLDQRYFNRIIHGYFIESWRDRTDTEIDTGHIDANAADCLVQVACFGTIVYG